MTFDKSKVLTNRDDGLKHWIGWKGFFADDYFDLMASVENEKEIGINVAYGELEEVCFKRNDYTFSSRCGIVQYKFFYPIEKFGNKITNKF